MNEGADPAVTGPGPARAPGDLRSLLEEREQAALLHDLIESSPDGIVAADMQGRIRLFNHGAERILGYTQQEALGQLSLRDLYLGGTAEEIVERMRCDEHGGRGRLSRQEFVAVTRQGAHIPISLTGGILQDAAGQEVAIFGIFRDLRGLREMQDRLVQSEKMASLGRLAAGVAHEINNPLSGIMLYANLVAEQLGESAPGFADLQVVLREAERCKQIVADLLDFSQPGSQESQAVSLNPLLEEIVAHLGRQPLFLGVRFERRLDPQLSSILVDPNRLTQVFTNILINAAQAMQGHGRISVVTRGRAKGNLVEAVISDTGPGIAEAVLPRIFEPFFTTRADAGGTGLGLSVCYAIVRENRGTIRVSSHPGSGASFSIRFPAIALDQRPATHGSAPEGDDSGDWRENDGREEEDPGGR